MSPAESLVIPTLKLDGAGVSLSMEASEVNAPQVQYICLVCRRLTLGISSYY